MVIELRDVSFGYNGEAIFNNVSLSVSCGDVVIISGPSGSGKSSLLRLLNRLSDPASGDIFLNGRPLNSYKAVEIRRQVHYMQQTPLMAEGTVRDNLVLPFSFRSLRETELPTDKALRDLLDMFRLLNVSLTDSAATLSVGQKQRLAFIRALLLKPKVLLLDEPTSALDPESRSVVEEHIDRLASEKSTAIIMITHLAFNPRAVAARRYVLDHSGLREHVE